MDRRDRIGRGEDEHSSGFLVVWFLLLPQPELAPARARVGYDRTSSAGFRQPSEPRPARVHVGRTVTIFR